MTDTGGKKREKEVLVKEFRPLRWYEKLYLPAVLQGLWLTIRHFLFRKTVTVQYPEKRLPVQDNFRGHQRLKLDEHGHVKCVACYLCATACPSECITIVAEEDADPEIEKAPLSFDVDMLRCIFCGYCEEACPKDAIVMGRDFEFARLRRDAFISDKDELTTHYDDEKNKPPAGSR